MNDTRDEIIDAIKEWDPVDGPSQWSDERLSQFARGLFAHQFAHNEPYRRFCQGRGVTPESIAHWRDVPAVPTDVFKHVLLTTAALDDVARTFQTSGTSMSVRGKHVMGSLGAYRASLHAPFVRACLPEQRPMRMLVLAPSGETLPESSLSFMLSELVDRWGAPGSDFFVREATSGELFVDLKGAVGALDEAQEGGEPVMLLGTAFGFMALFDQQQRSWSLAPGSRLMETGGFKGKSREISRDELYDMFMKRLRISSHFCVSEYSMTELSSQSYTLGLYDHWRGEGDAFLPNTQHAPPWARIEIVDPHTLTPLDEPGAEGLVRWFDLANHDSVMMIQTSDRARRMRDGGVQLLGRARASEMRGCSLTIEEILEANEP